MDYISENTQLDQLMAELLLHLSQYQLNEKIHTLSKLNHCLEKICHHHEIDLYPAQYSVLHKMQHFWKTKQWETQI